MRLIEALINKYFYVNIQGVNNVRVDTNINQYINKNYGLNDYHLNELTSH